MGACLPLLPGLLPQAALGLVPGSSLGHGALLPAPALATGLTAGLAIAAGTLMGAAPAAHAAATPAGLGIQRQGEGGQGDQELIRDRPRFLGADQAQNTVSRFNQKQSWSVPGFPHSHTAPSFTSAPSSSSTPSSIEGLIRYGGPSWKDVR